MIISYILSCTCSNVPWFILLFKKETRKKNKVVELADVKRERGLFFSVSKSDCNCFQTILMHLSQSVISTS